MKFNPHGLRFYFAIRLALVFLLVAAIMIYTALSYISATTVENHMNLAQVLAEEIAVNSEYGFLTGDKVILGKMLEGVKRQKNVAYAAIVEKEGTGGILYEFSRGGYHPQPLAPLPAAIQKEKFSFGKYRMVVGVTCPVYAATSPNDAESLLFEGAGEPPPRKAKTLRGAVRVFITLDDDRVEIGRLSALVVTGVAAGLLLLVFMLYAMLSRQVIGPLDEFIRGVREIEEGNLDYRIPLRSRSEIKKLVEAFNDSVEKRQHALKELSRYYEQLEELVIARTRELQTARDQAEEATRLKDKFVTAASHDLRSPIASLQVLIRHMQGRPEIQVNPETKNVFAAALKNTQGLLKLIDALLNLNRIQMGKFTYRFGECDAARIVTIAIEPLQALADAKNITIHNFLKPGLTIKADEALFVQAIQNLVSNAIKFCECGDGISIAGEMTDKGFALNIKDTGIGIPPENLERLFAGNIIQSVPGTAGELGTGLGLQFCHEIIKAHGGRITVESTVGEGTAFTISIPAEPLRSS
ncbi:MAG: HAMP domain-containing histidine kinase [Nitrospinae bacterium]|nr:HAMP domain-containing histidine kinase [Nitrospinota bacterium]